MPMNEKWNVEPGCIIDVKMLDGSKKEHYLEDGPYFPEKGRMWITVANDEGELISAQWNMDNDIWEEMK